MTDRHLPGIDRRHLLAAGLGAAGVVGLAACGDGSTAGGNDPLYGGDQGGGASASTPSASGSSGTAAQGSVTAAAPALIAVADVPVGGAASAKGADGTPIIVAQPEAGTVVAFSAICTHNRCTVAPAGSQITCPCHQSTFAIADGARVSGPAQRPLAKVPVSVVDGQVVQA